MTSFVGRIQMEMMQVALACVVGLAFGSFANVFIHRWPQGGSITHPRRSACPECGIHIRAVDNMPVVSWVLLRGRCRDCEAAISPRYLIVEALMGLLFVAVTLVWGIDPLLPGLLVMTWSMVVASFIDLEHQIIPNRLTLRLPLILLPLLVAVAWYDDAWIDLRRAVIAGIALPAGMLALSELFRLVRGQSGIGMGDIKFAISLGLVVGYLGGWHLVVFGYATIIAAMVIVIGLAIAGRASLATRIPFGPYLSVGALVTILAGDPATALARRVLGF
ncbi:MAG: prepilin peptidase [Dehalococcoidia bacterium]